jgi:hypothetical protein
MPFMLLGLSILVGSTVVPQEPLQVMQPLQPVPAFLAQPVSAAASDGQVIRVFDENQQPVAGASVFVGAWANLADVDRGAVEHFFVADAPIWASARASLRFLTDATGSVRVPRLAGATIGAIHPETGAVALCLVGTRIRLRGQRVPFRVEVLDVEGRPAAGVPVGIGRSLGVRGGDKVGAFTDAQGRVTLLWQTDGERAEDIEVRVACVDGPTTAARVPWPAAGSAAPLVQLRLPPVVGLRLQLRDARDQPVSDSAVTAFGRRYGGVTKAVRVADGEYFVWPIAPGGVVRLDLRHAGATGVHQEEVVEGPAVAGSVATVKLQVEHRPRAVTDPRLIATLQQLAGAQPAGALPQGALPQVGMPQLMIPVGGRVPSATAVGRIDLALDPALAAIDGLACELRRRNASAELEQPVLHPLRLRHQAGRTPLPALLGQSKLSSDLTSHVLDHVEPGTYQLRVLLGSQEVRRVASIDVLAGPVGSVPAADGAPVAPLPTRSVRLVDHDGKPASGALQVQGHAKQRIATLADGSATLPHVAGVRWLATSPNCRSSLLPADGAEVRTEVALEPRCRVRVVAAPNVVVPDGVWLCISNPLDPELATWHPFRHGSDNVVSPDGSGTVSLSLWAKYRFRERVPLEWEWPIELPLGDREVVFELRLDAEQLEQIGKVLSQR